MSDTGFNMDLIRKVALLKMLKDEYSAKLTAINTQLPVLAEKAHEEFLRTNMKQVTIEPTLTATDKETGEIKTITLFKDGKARKIEPAIDVKPNINSKDQKEVYHWFKTVDNGAHAEMVKETIHFKSLESWVKAQRKENKPIPETIKVFDVHTVKISKVKTSTKETK